MSRNTTALVVFGNLNQVARINLSLKRRASNRLLPAPSLGSGFEDIAIDHRHGRAFCLIEAMEDFDGFLRGFVAEYDRAGRFLHCTRLRTRFEEANKGFEGLAHVWRGGREYLYALCEGNLGTGRHAGGGRVSTCSFARATGAGRRRTESACQSRRSSRTMPRSPIATGNLPSSHRRRRVCGWPGSTGKRVPWCRDRTPSIASRARATAMSRESPGCPVTPWSPSPTGRRGGRPLAAPRRIRASIYSGSQRTETRKKTSPRTIAPTRSGSALDARDGKGYILRLHAPSGWHWRSAVGAPIVALPEGEIEVSPPWRAISILVEL
jgi:hypothetical protein